MKHHQMLKHFSTTTQPVLELTGVRCFLIPPGQLQMNSPATFQTMMNVIFTKEIAEGWLIVYMDDILVATKDGQEFHN